ncbi:MAG TPA: hypothetical protein VGC61_10075 [Pyrinomonadaceae bacterium]|jgi:hypothetical protein
MRLHLHSLRKRKKGDTAQLAAQLAPLEEVDKNGAARQLAANAPAADTHTQANYGAIVVDNEGLHVPQDIMEGGNEKTYLGMEPVVLVILAVMLVFIAFVAWQITKLPVQ